MEKSKLIQLFQSLSPAERRRFKKWLQSPAHNPNNTITEFYQYLDQRSTLTGRTLRRERIFEALFPGKPYDDLIIRRLMSEFLDVLEDFLAYETWQRRPVARLLDLARLYRDRRQSHEALGALRAARARLDEQGARDAEYHLELYRIQEEQFRQAAARDTALNLQEMNDALAHFFVAEMLRNACAAASHQAIYRANYTIPYLEHVLTDCAAGRYDAIPVITLYYHTFRCLTEPGGVQHFYALKTRLPAAADWLQPHEWRGVLLQAINYGIRRLNTDEPAFLREVFDLYQLGLDKAVFLENGVLSRFTYKNIVSAAVKLGEIPWAETFIRGYAVLLPAAHRASYERFCMAKVRYEQGRYAEAQDLLHDLASDDVFLDLDARVLLLKIYAAQGAWRLLEAFLRTFERFVSRKKMLAYHAPNYLNIIHFSQKLLPFLSGARPADGKEMQALREQITRAQPLTEREWLLRICP